MALRSPTVDESVLTKPETRPDTDSVSVDSRVRTVPAQWQHVAYGVVVAGVVGGLAWMWLGSRQVKAGMMTVAVALIVAAVARLVLPERRAGLLVSRPRVADVMVLAFLGTCIMALSLVLPPPS
jgi:hypothetical protein